MNLRGVDAPTGLVAFPACVSDPEVPATFTFNHSRFSVCFLRSSSTSPQWICTGVTCVGTTTWKSEMDIGEKLH